MISSEQGTVSSEQNNMQVERFEEKDCIIYGCGGHGLVIFEIMEAAGDYVVRGFLDDGKPPGFREGAPAGLEIPPVLGPVGSLPEFVELGLKNIFIAIGDNAARERIIRETSALRLDLVNAVHPNAVLSKRVKLGRSVAVMAGAVVNAMSVLEDGVIVNTGATVDHHNRLGACVHVAPGAHLGGSVSIGERTLVGIGASVMRGVRIGNDCLICCGAPVCRNVGDGQKVKL